jgi:hypothetical protein
MSLLSRPVAVYAQQRESITSVTRHDDTAPRDSRPHRQYPGTQPQASPRGMDTTRLPGDGTPTRQGEADRAGEDRLPV